MASLIDRSKLAGPPLLILLLAACGAKPPEPARTPDAATAAPSSPSPAPKATPSATPKTEPTATAAPAAPTPRPASPPAAPAARPAPAAAPASTSPSRVAAAAPAPPPPPKRERIAVVNSCSKPVRLFFKRAGADLQTSLNTSTRTEEPATDGDTLQLMDDTGRNELARMVITSSMKEIVIVSGCAKLESR